MLVFLCCRTPKDDRGYDSFYDGMRAIARSKEPAPIACVEDIAVKNPDKSSWERFLGRYEKKDERFPSEDVCIKDGELYCSVVWDEAYTEVCRLYPIGENEFGRKRGMLDLKIGDGCLMFDDVTCKKL